MKLRQLVISIAAAALFATAAATADAASFNGPQGPVKFSVCLEQASSCNHDAVHQLSPADLRLIPAGVAVSGTVTCDTSTDADGLDAVPGFHVRLKVGTRVSDTFVCGDYASATEPFGLTRSVPVWNVRSTRMRWSVSVDGQVVNSGVLSIKRTAQTAASRWRIWESDFDDYVNVCINGNHRLWASGGRLYCDVVSPAMRSFRYDLDTRFAVG